MGHDGRSDAGDVMQDESGARDPRGAFPGLSRRDFLRYCGKIAGLLAVTQATGPRIATLLAQEAAKGSDRPSVIWSDFQMCTGCTVSLAQNASPGAAELILNVISLDYQETLMVAAGAAAERAFADAVQAGDYFYVVEGAIATGIPMAMTVGGRSSVDIAKDAAAKAKAVIAIGTCAAYGGIQAARPDPTGAVGVAEFLAKEGIGTPVINLPTCPGNGDNLVATLVYHLFFDKLPELDPIGRPLFLYGQTVHDNCYRRGHFENGEFVERFGTVEEELGYCLYKVGCKGPETYAPCSKLEWNNHMNWCVGVGPCIGCSEPGFWDRFAPYYERRPDIASGLAGVDVDTVGLAVAGATAVGLGAHFIGQAASGRLRRGARPEPPDNEEEAR